MDRSCFKMPFAVVAMLAISSSLLFFSFFAETALLAQNGMASCVMAEGRAVIFSPGSTPFGEPSCVQDRVGVAQACLPEGKTVARYEIHEQTRKNVVPTAEPVISRPSERCVEAKFTSRPYDHRGSYPAYVCSPMLWENVLVVYSCPK
jgi:hypothetical protein